MIWVLCNPKVTIMQKHNIERLRIWNKNNSHILRTEWLKMSLRIVFVGIRWHTSMQLFSSSFALEIKDFYSLLDRKFPIDSPPFGIVHFHLFLR